jgi:hypothetical protein
MRKTSLSVVPVRQDVRVGLERIIGKTVNADQTATGRIIAQCAKTGINGTHAGTLLIVRKGTWESFHVFAWKTGLPLIGLPASIFPTRERFTSVLGTSEPKSCEGF